MTRYLKSISLVVSMIGIIVPNIFASDTKEQGEDKPFIKFQSCIYYPDTKRFTGNFFHEAENISSQLGGFYTKKYMELRYAKLPQAQGELESIKIGFDKEKLAQLKLQKLALKEKGISLNVQDLGQYKALKQQEGEIILQEAVVEYFDAQVERYNKRRTFITDMPEIFQKLFYLELLHPQRLYISSHSYYISQSDETHEHKSVVWDASESQVLSKIKPEQIAGIDLEELEKASKYIFGFLDKYVYQLDNEKSDRISGGKDYTKVQKIINCSQSDQVLNSLKLNNLIPQEDLNQMFKKFYIKTLRKDKEKMENEIKPLALFYLSFIQTLESFQKEVAERKKCPPISWIHF